MPRPAPIRMKFVDASLGARFRYEGQKRVWVKLSNDNCGLVAEYDAENMRTPKWYGQQICSAADSWEETERLFVLVIG